MAEVVSVRLEPETLDALKEIEAHVKSLTPPGVKITRTDAVTFAIETTRIRIKEDKDKAVK